MTDALRCRFAQGSLALSARVALTWLFKSMCPGWVPQHGPIAIRGRRCESAGGAAAGAGMMDRRGPLGSRPLPFVMSSGPDGNSVVDRAGITHTTPERISSFIAAILLVIVHAITSRSADNDVTRRQHHLALILHRPPLQVCRTLVRIASMVFIGQ